MTSSGRSSSVVSVSDNLPSGAARRTVQCNRPRHRTRGLSPSAVIKRKFWHDVWYMSKCIRDWSLSRPLTLALTNSPNTFRTVVLDRYPSCGHLSRLERPSCQPNVSCASTRLMMTFQSIIQHISGREQKLVVAYIRYLLAPADNIGPPAV